MLSSAIKMDHLRGMTAEAIAGRPCGQGKAERRSRWEVAVLVSRFLPRLADQSPLAKYARCSSRNEPHNQPVSRRLGEANDEGSLLKRSLSP